MEPCNEGFALATANGEIPFEDAAVINIASLGASLRILVLDHTPLVLRSGQLVEEYSCRAARSKALGFQLFNSNGQLLPTQVGTWLPSLCRLMSC